MLKLNSSTKDERIATQQCSIKAPPPVSKKFTTFFISIFVATFLHIVSFANFTDSFRIVLPPVKITIYEKDFISYCSDQFKVFGFCANAWE
jgi:hypothetical protein